MKLLSWSSHSPFLLRIIASAPNYLWITDLLSSYNSSSELHQSPVSKCKSAYISFLLLCAISKCKSAYITFLLLCAPNYLPDKVPVPYDPYDACIRLFNDLISIGLFRLLFMLAFLPQTSYNFLNSVGPLISLGFPKNCSLCLGQHSLLHFAKFIDSFKIQLWCQLSWNHLWPIRVWKCSSFEVQRYLDIPPYCNNCNVL